MRLGAQSLTANRAGVRKNSPSAMRSKPFLALWLAVATRGSDSTIDTDAHQRVDIPAINNTAEHCAQKGRLAGKTIAIKLQKIKNNLEFLFDDEAN